MARVNRFESIPSIVMLAIVLTLGGCSSPQNGGVEEPVGDHPVGDAEGDEDPLAVAEPEPEPIKRGPGRLRIDLKAGGQPGTGRLRILTAEVEPRLVEEGPASQTYELEAGSYDVEVTLESILDQPERRLRDVPVKTGALTEREIDFTVGTIVLQPKRGNSPVRSKVRWRYNGGGDWFEGHSQTGEDLVLSTGRYDAEVMLGNTAIVISDIQVYEGRRSLAPPVVMGGGRR